MAGFSDLVAASAESLLTQDLRVRAGTTWTRGWTARDGSSTLVDFTGATATLLVKDKVGGTQKMTFTQTLTNGLQIILSNGTVTLSATSAATTGLATTETYRGVYELKITKSGETVSFVSGRINIYPAV